MAATQKIKITTKRVRKTGGDSGYVKCRICHGTGRQKAPTKKKK